MREKVIERYLVQEVKKLNGRAVKLTSSNNRGLPDRLVILPNFIGFIELKAPGRTPTDLQVKWISFIKTCGHAAIVIDSRPKVDAFISWYKRFKLKEHSNGLSETNVSNPQVRSNAFAQQQT